jgi:ABC-type iron transport system FetAB permease component
MQILAGMEPVAVVGCQLVIMIAAAVALACYLQIYHIKE